MAGGVIGSVDRVGAAEWNSRRVFLLEPFRGRLVLVQVSLADALFCELSA